MKRAVEFFFNSIKTPRNFYMYNTPIYQYYNEGFVCKVEAEILILIFKYFYCLTDFTQFIEVLRILNILLDASSSSYVYDVLDVSNWPSGKQLGLDSSQVGALKSALTNELSIIQGPPGTGKTFVGLMIVKILLHNRESNTNKSLR